MTTTRLHSTPTSAFVFNSSGIANPAVVSTHHIVAEPSSGGLLYVPGGRTWDGWELTTELFVDVSTTRQQVLATTYLTVAEYGVGESMDEALVDLLTSLSDYRESLEKREDRLGPPAAADLDKLRKLVQRRPQL